MAILLANFLGTLIHLPSHSKAYLREGGGWLQQQAKGKRILTNDLQLAFYATDIRHLDRLGREIVFELPNDPSDVLNQYDYIALRQKVGDEATRQWRERWVKEAKIVREIESGRKQRVLILSHH